MFHQEKDVAVDEAPSEADGAEAEAPVEETTENVGEATFSYDRLISKSTDPVRGIDYKRREVCLLPHPYICDSLQGQHLDNVLSFAWREVYIERKARQGQS